MPEFMPDRLPGYMPDIDILFDGRTNVGIHVRADTRTKVGP